MKTRRSGCFTAQRVVAGMFATVGGLTGPLAARGDEPLAAITGGADAAGRAYRWTIANQHTSPIVYVEFPHYHASLFHAPAGWTTESTFLVNVGVPDKPGVCTARAPAASSGIPRGRAADFDMSVSPDGTRRGQGNVLLRFADGVSFSVTNVELPVPETSQNKNLPLIGLSMIIIAALAIRTLRARSAGKASHETPTGTE